VSTTAQAHPNIALIKYWGKQRLAGNIPATPSLSITLDELTTTTSVADDERDRVFLNGSEVNDPKITACLAMLRREFNVPPLIVRTDNNFPTAAGLASSASGFAALITAIDAHCELELTDRQRSSYARQASGSAARSIHGGFVGLNEPDWVAEPLLDAEDWPLKVVIAITDTARKAVSSSAGMQASEQNSPYFPAWVSSTREDYRAALEAVVEKDFSALIDLSESSCLKMHAVMQSSKPAMLYWRPATLSCIEAVREMRASGIAVFFTIDAGPQIKAVCTPQAVDTVARTLAAIPGVLDTRVVGLGGCARVIRT
jgi:diphosphomevalonate decarboxylase